MVKRLGVEKLGLVVPKGIVEVREGNGGTEGENGGEGKKRKGKRENAGLARKSMWREEGDVAGDFWFVEDVL